MPADQVHQVRMGHLDALRLTGGTGRIDHIGEVVVAGQTGGRPAIAGAKGFAGRTRVEYFDPPSYPFCS